MCDNTSVISLSKYIVHYSKPKNIDIKNHFIGYYVEIKYFMLNFVDSKIQLVDYFTKPFLEEKIYFLWKRFHITSFEHA